MFYSKKRGKTLESQIKDLVMLNEQREELTILAEKLNRLETKGEGMFGSYKHEWFVSSAKPELFSLAGNLTLEKAKARLYDLSQRKR
jgi:hypothetical protein